jgi:hypothetical protein
MPHHLSNYSIHTPIHTHSYLHTYNHIYKHHLSKSLLSIHLLLARLARQRLHHQPPLAPDDADHAEDPYSLYLIRAYVPLVSSLPTRASACCLVSVQHHPDHERPSILIRWYRMQVTGCCHPAVASCPAPASRSQHSVLLCTLHTSHPRFCQIGHLKEQEFTSARWRYHHHHCCC